MTHNPEVCSYSAISLINNSFHHLSDCREGRECREKTPDDEGMTKNVWRPESWGLLMN
jgi:hypothetical protein